MSNKLESISVEGVNLPNKALTNFELLDAVKKLNVSKFRGIYMRNDLPRRPFKSESGILNLDGVSGRGTHWVCWYKKPETSRNLSERSSGESRRLSPGFLSDTYFFDSFGVQPPNELMEYISSPIYYSTERIQPDGEVVCGHLCLYMLCRLSRGDKFQKIINDLH